MEEFLAIAYLLSVAAVANFCYYAPMYLVLYKITDWYRWAGDKRTTLWMLGLSVGLALMTLGWWHRLLWPLMGRVWDLVN